MKFKMAAAAILNLLFLSVLVKWSIFGDSRLHLQRLIDRKTDTISKIGQNVKSADAIARLQPSPTEATSSSKTIYSRSLGFVALPSKI